MQMPEALVVLHSFSVWIRHVEMIANLKALAEPVAH